VEISLGDGVADTTGKKIPIVVRLLAAGQSVYMAGSKALSPVPSKIKGKKVDENDRSLVFVLEYGSFRYFGGGDIAGDGMAAGGNVGNQAMPDPKQGKAKSGKKKRAKLGFSYTHADVESLLGPAMELALPKADAWVAGKDWYPNAGHCTVMKASHHASASSVDVYFLATVRPRVVAISSGIKKKHHGHPTQEVLNRLDDLQSEKWKVRGSVAEVANTVEGIYVTEMAKKVSGITITTDVHEAKLLGDVVIRPVDESIVAVRAATTPTPLRIHVYGTGDKTILVDTDNLLRAGEPVTAGAAAYRVGPYHHPPLS
jgi:hypothetical protein